MGRRPSDPRAAAVKRRQRFIRVASARTQKVLDDMALLENCSRRDIYNYSVEDIDKILSALQEGLDSIKRTFQVGKHGFVLSDDNTKENEV